MTLRLETRRTDTEGFTRLHAQEAVRQSLLEAQDAKFYEEMRAQWEELASASSLAEYKSSMHKVSVCSL